MQRDAFSSSPAPIAPTKTLNRIGQGRHFLQIPGPTNVPDRVLRAIDFPTIDHRGPEFQKLALKILDAIKPVFGTTCPVVIYPGSGTGAWEAALVNTLNAGDTVLMAETGHFATLWKKLAEKLGLVPEFIAGSWRRGGNPQQLEDRLRQDAAFKIKAVCVVHNETSTGVTSDIAAVRRAIDAANHPALLMVDTISSMGSVEFKHDEWGVDVTIAGSQKGLMLPPGISFNAVSRKAVSASKTSRLPKAYWGWEEIIAANSGAITPLLNSLAADLNSLISNIESENFIAEVIKDGQEGRALIPGKHGGKAREYTHLPIVIEDKPGQLAAIFDECAKVSVNIEDLSIEHSPGQETGLITLAVSHSDAATLKAHLESQGWDVHAPRS